MNEFETLIKIPTSRISNDIKCEFNTLKMGNCLFDWSVVFIVHSSTNFQSDFSFIFKALTFIELKRNKSQQQQQKKRLLKQFTNLSE